MRNTKTTLFNKNNIVVTRCNRSVDDKKKLQPWSPQYHMDTNRIEYNKHVVGKEGYYAEPYWKRKPSKGYKDIHGVEVPSAYNLKMSELGFYYSVPKIEEGATKQTNTPCKKNNKTFAIWTFYTSNFVYSISYLTEANGVSIDVDSRPWQLTGDSMEDHFVNDLLDEVTKICDEAKVLKLKMYEQRTKYRGEQSYMAWEQVGAAHSARHKIFTDLFGNPNGPRYQTNNEKILAHGFDLITSFRKM